MCDGFVHNLHFSSGAVQLNVEVNIDVRLDESEGLNTCQYPYLTPLPRNGAPSRLNEEL